MLIGPRAICPHCEKPLEGHSAKDCPRKLSRRHFFFGLLAAPLVAKGLTEVIPRPSILEGWSVVAYRNGVRIAVAEAIQSSKGVFAAMIGTGNLQPGDTVYWEHKPLDHRHVADRISVPNANYCGILPESKIRAELHLHALG